MSVYSLQLFSCSSHATALSDSSDIVSFHRTQDEPAFCGLASIAMVLSALAIDPKRAWKGPWRWFHEQMLDCCQPLTQVLQTGIVLDQVSLALHDQLHISCRQSATLTTTQMHEFVSCFEYQYRMPQIMSSCLAYTEMTTCLFSCL